MDGAQPLADVDEFCGKIRTARDHQVNDDFVIVARTEGLIAGVGIPEALQRAVAFVESGADAVFVHSKRPDAREICAFMMDWDGAAPIVIAPTTYASTSLQDLISMGIHNFIFGNLSLRTVISALQRNLAILRRSYDQRALEGHVAPLEEVFRLQDVAELKEAERRYLPSRVAETKKVCL